MKEFMMAMISEESLCWGGPAPAVPYVDGVALLPVAVLHVIFLLRVTLWGWREHGCLRFLRSALFLTNKR